MAAWLENSVSKNEEFDVFVDGNDEEKGRNVVKNM
jgi:hypothetical protein